jgi:hypothetical protein
MKWLSLYNKIGKQHLSVTRKADVLVIVEGKEIKVTGIKFKADGSPYLVTE